MSIERNILNVLVCCFLVIWTGHAQDDPLKAAEDGERLMLKVKEGARPLVYIDGKVYDPDVVEMLDQDKIGSMDVIKGERAIKEFDAPNGVIVIRSKKSLEMMKGAGNDSQGEGVKLRKKAGDDLRPVIVIDGEVSDEQTLGNYKPDDIEHIEVLKGRTSIEKYNAPNGVVVVTTKTKKKQGLKHKEKEK